MQPNNLTALDFEDIKASIKSYLRTRTEFTDYDFDGSSLSYLIDTLAYNSYYTAFNANMSLNETFLPSATVRDNVVNIAKLLNYVPRSISTSKACLKLEVQTQQTGGAYPTSVTLRKGPVATGGAYIWNILNDVTATVNASTGIATFDSLIIYEGAIVNFTYVVNTFASQNYKVPSEDADISTLTVKVRPNESSTEFDLYNRVDTVTNLTPTTRAFFLAEGEDMRYEVRFGDDSVGRALKDGEVVEFEYVVTSGGEANDNDATKKSIAADLRQYAMASIDPVIIDPEDIYIYNKIFVQYDTGCGDDTTTIKTDVQNAINQWAAQTEINNFNSTFRSQSFEKAITLASKCVSDVSLQTTVVRYIKPVTNQTNTYVIATGSPLYNSAPSQTQSENATKEPILLSGTFRTADRPGVNQQFEDDGFGNLRVFYNTVLERLLPIVMRELSTMTTVKLHLDLLI